MRRRNGKPQYVNVVFGLLVLASSGQFRCVEFGFIKANWHFLACPNIVIPRGKVAGIEYDENNAQNVEQPHQNGPSFDMEDWKYLLR